LAWLFWPEQKSDADIDTLTQNQINFEEARNIFYSRWEYGNAIQKSNVLNDSNEYLCAFVEKNGRVFENWVGAVKSLNTNLGGSEVTDFSIISDVFGRKVEYRFLSDFAIGGAVTISRGSEV
jgi:hypothetical protein